ncbi:hypothetical protein TUMEXPCC7403_10815 [Tumidithrix helvetica PCC 7403]|uniref:hypothetical protein n=1 Tax=Tumidithrix helvetica TaxID=3457545 RepID=UPI003C7F1619
MTLSRQNLLIYWRSLGKIPLLGVFTLFLSIVISPVLGNIQKIEPLLFDTLLSRCVKLPKSSSILSADLSTDASLEWNITTRKEGDYYNYYLASVSYRKQGKILWTRSLPERLANQAIERSYKKPVNIHSYNGFPFLLGTIFTDNTIFVADSSGVLVLDRNTGKTLEDKSAESSPDLFFIDWGTVKLTTPTQHCEIKIQGGQFFSGCGEVLIYFNRKNLWVWNQSSQLLETANYSQSKHRIDTHKPLQYQARIPLKTVVVEISGFVGE